jgi:hypothetical protein
MKITKMVVGLLICSINLVPTKALAYETIQVNGGDLSGYRQSNVKVDIGYGDREYWAYTNEYGQLIRVEADEIILQDDSKEPVNSKGRYYNDEAKVSGVESKYLDEGHVIADSLGGVSNAYNITPQESYTNRYGKQAQMEEHIRNAGGCTDFLAIITYDDETQIPTHYSYSYKINGKTYSVEFNNEYDNEEQYSNNNKTTINEEGNIYHSNSNNYYHYDKYCKFLKGLNIYSNNSTEGKRGCHCTESWYR